MICFLRIFLVLRTSGDFLAILGLSKKPKLWNMFLFFLRFLSKSKGLCQGYTINKTAKA